MKLATHLLIFSAICSAEALPVVAGPQSTSLAGLKWSYSALVAVNALDLLSSRGKLEANPLLRTPDGTFSLEKGVAMKAVLLIPLGYAEYRLSKRHPKAARALVWVNVALTGATYSVSLHNLTIR